MSSLFLECMLRLWRAHKSRRHRRQSQTVRQKMRILLTAPELMPFCSSLQRTGRLEPAVARPRLASPASVGKPRGHFQSSHRRCSHSIWDLAYRCDLLNKYFHILYDHISWIYFLLKKKKKVICSFLFLFFFPVKLHGCMILFFLTGIYEVKR